MYIYINIHIYIYTYTCIYIYDSDINECGAGISCGFNGIELMFSVIQETKV